MSLLKPLNLIKLNAIFLLWPILFLFKLLSALNVCLSLAGLTTRLDKNMANDLKNMAFPWHPSMAAIHNSIYFPGKEFIVNFFISN